MQLSKSFLRTNLSKTPVQFYRYSIRLDVPSAKALTVARKAYRHNPDTILQLTKQFPDFDPSDIAKAVFGHRDPDAFLTRVQEQIPKFEKQFPDLEPWIINQAAIGHPNNPVGFLNKLQEGIPSLREKYPDVPPWVIKRALMSRPESVESYVKSYLDSTSKASA